MGHPVSLAHGTSVWMAAAGYVVLLPPLPCGLAWGVWWDVSLPCTRGSQELNVFSWAALRCLCITDAL